MNAVAMQKKNNKSNNEISTIAKFYVKEWNLSVIPLIVNAKTPAVKWQEYQHRIPTEEEIEAFVFGNLGIITGKVSFLVVFDADSKETVDFLYGFSEFRETTQVITRRGAHFYFTVEDIPPDFSTQRVERGDIKIDIKANGGYVVAPPSVVEGHEYEFVNDYGDMKRPFVEISFVELVSIIKKIKEKLGVKEISSTEKKKEYSENKRYKIDLEKIKEQILQSYEKGRRQNIIIYLTGFLLKQGVDIESIENFITEIVHKTGDEEWKMRLAGMKETILKFQNGKEIKGITGLLEAGIELQLEETFDFQAKKKINIETVAEVISHIVHDRLDYDKFFVNFFYENQPFDDMKEVFLHAEVEKMLERRVPTDIFKQAVSYIAYSNVRDRLVEYLMDCKKNWDGIYRIESFFTKAFGIDESEYTKAVAKNLFLGAVARALQPGCFLKTVPVIIGKQNIGKSRAIAALGGNFYKEINVSISTEKDFFMSIQGVWIAEVPEMEALRKADRNRIKAIISATTDRFRPPYSRLIKDFPRRCVFVVSTNENTIYEDPTGGTRFLPLQATTADVEWIEIHRDLLWGEATYRYLHGERDFWRLPHETTYRQEEVRRADEWETIIFEWISNLKVKETTISEIAEKALSIPMKDLDKSKQMRIAESLTALGFTRKTMRKGEKVFKVWVKD